MLHKFSNVIAHILLTVTLTLREVKEFILVQGSLVLNPVNIISKFLKAWD